MRIFLIEFNVDIAAQINPTMSYKLNRDTDLPHSAIVLDQCIFGGRQDIDWVLFASNTNIKFDEFLSIERHIPRDSKTIFSTTGNILDSYYCRPAIFSILGNSYKTSENLYLMLARQRIDIQHI